MARYGKLGVKRKKTFKQTSNKRRRYVKGYRGGRPTYATMLRNAWPLRSSSGVKRKSGKGKKLYQSQGPFKMTSTIVKGRKTKLAKAYKPLGADHIARGMGAFNMTNATTGIQYMKSKLVQLGTLGGPSDGTELIQHFTALGLQAVPTSSIFFKYGRLEFEIASACNVPIKLDIYDIVAKKSLTPDGTTNMNPEEIAVRDYDTSFLSADATAQLQVDTNLPPGKTVFDQYFRVVRRRKLVLFPGQIHKHMFHKSVRRMIQHTEISHGWMETNQGFGTTLVRDLTFGCMFAMNGFPISSTTDNTKVSTSGGKLNITWKYSCNFKAITDNTRMFRTNTNSRDPMMQSSDPQTMLDDADQRAAVTFA